MSVFNPLLRIFMSADHIRLKRFCFTVFTMSMFNTWATYPFFVYLLKLSLNRLHILCVDRLGYIPSVTVSLYSLDAIYCISRFYFHMIGISEI